MENYSSKKLELLVLKWAVTEKFRDYLLGSTFTVYTDNNPLTYIMTQKKLPAVEQRWVNASFNFSLQYRSGKENVNADILSRLPCINHEEVSSSLASVTSCATIPLGIQQLAMEDAVSDIGLPEKSLIESSAYSCQVYVESTLPVYTNEEIRKLQEDDKTISEMKKDKRVCDVNGLLGKKIVCPGGDKILLLVPEVLRKTVLEQVHDNHGHQGIERTEELVRMRFYWPDIRKSVTEWIEACQRCRVAKLPCKTVRTPLGHLTASRPLELVCVDYTLIECREL